MAQVEYLPYLACPVIPLYPALEHDDYLHAVEPSLVKGIGHVRVVFQHLLPDIPCLLFLREGHRVWGHVDRVSGAVILKAAQTSAEDEDVLDGISEETLIRDGEVLVLPEDRMPTEMPVAAILRY